VFISNTVIPTPLDKAVIADHVLLLALQFPMLGRQKGTYVALVGGLGWFSEAIFGIIYHHVRTCVCGCLWTALAYPEGQAIASSFRGENGVCVDGDRSCGSDFLL
jgi:hypothetical protein